jgi:hypothetical protein
MTGLPTPPVKTVDFALSTAVTPEDFCERRYTEHCQGGRRSEPCEAVAQRAASPTPSAIDTARSKSDMGGVSLAP